MGDSANTLTEKQKPDNRTAAQKRRAEYQEALREHLRNSGLLQAIQEDLSRDLTPDEIQVVKFKTETRLKLLGKILPDLKESMVGGSDSGIPVPVSVNVRFPDG